MSKTHKITQLKKRIAELERRKNRIENPLVNPLRIDTYPCRVTPLVVEHQVRFEEYQHFSSQREYQEHLSREIAKSFVDSDTFKIYIKTEVMTPQEPYFPVVIRAAVMVAPFEGDLWEVETT